MNQEQNMVSLNEGNSQNTLEPFFPALFSDLQNSGDEVHQKLNCKKLTSRKKKFSLL
jgi:hypothetical protein